MSREYRHIKEYEREIMELRDQGLTQRQIGERLGFTRQKIKDFIKRTNRNQRKITLGIPSKPQGRPRKYSNTLPPSVQKMSKVSQLQYELAMKERHIKSLEMENELMRDFLSLTERK